MSERNNKIIDWFRRFTWKQRLIMYAAVVMLAVVYVFVFSDSNYHIHQKLNTKIKEQEAELKKAEKNVEIQSVNKDFKNDSVTRERYRREQLNMKKENEDLFLIKE
ncbi:MAG: septum formation initiator family protein [Bacteroidales bacterium]|nr:septum formation initiator family protein [Bacteroidales bacterium]